VLLVLVGAVTDFAEPVDEHRPRQAVAGLALIQLATGVPAKVGVLDPVQGEKRPLQPAKFPQRRREIVLGVPPGLKPAEAPRPLSLEGSATSHGERPEGLAHRHEFHSIYIDVAGQA
jgi:hypothetical protein